MALLGCLAVAVLAALGLTHGSYPLSLQQVGAALLHPEAADTSATVVWQLRLPRIALGLVTGASLGAAGAACQGLMRSPLADPYLTGASAGASLGICWATLLGLAVGLQPAAGFLGALLAVWVAARLARSSGRLMIDDLLLSGVVTSTFLGSLVTLSLSLAHQDVARVLFFLLGTLESASWTTLAGCVPLCALGGLLLARNAYALNLLSLGDELATPAGVASERVKGEALLGAALLTACAVASAGMVGFVGLVTPHLCRLWVGADQRLLLPLAALWGSAFLLACDLLARWGGSSLPVGVITALVGGPFFLSQLTHHRRARSA